MATQTPDVESDAKSNARREVRIIRVGVVIFVGVCVILLGSHQPPWQYYGRVNGPTKIACDIGLIIVAVGAWNELGRKRAH